MSVTELLPSIGSALTGLAMILGGYWAHRGRMKRLDLYKHVIDYQKADDAVAIINVIKPATPWNSRTRSVSNHEEPAKTQPSRCSAPRDDPSESRDGTRRECLDEPRPDEPEAV